MKSVSFSEETSLPKSCVRVNFSEKEKCSALILLGIVSKVSDSNWFCVGEKSRDFHEVAGLTCNSLTISWATRTSLIGWVIVPVLVIVQRKITVHIKEATKGYMTAIVSRLKQLCICLLLSVSCYIVLPESIQAKFPLWFTTKLSWKGM